MKKNSPQIIETKNEKDLAAEKKWDIDELGLTDAELRHVSGAFDTNAVKCSPNED